jgi:hypothetical protein
MKFGVRRFIAAFRHPAAMRIEALCQMRKSGNEVPHSKGETADANFRFPWECGDLSPLCDPATD